LEPEKCKLLIVDDEPALRRALRTSLTGSDFEVSEARTGEEALVVMRTARPDVILLDINMPGMTGFEVCRRIRGDDPRTGIIMVTVRDSEEDKVRALEAGADDFVTKPYRLRELVARVRAVMRRLNGPAHPAETVFRAGNLELDLEHRLVTKNGVEIHLSPKEFDLLAYLFQHQGGPILHSKLLQVVWGPEYGGELEYLRSYIKMLRKKIEDDPARPEYILTEPWVGYRFRDPSDPHSPPSDEE
jgi:two-component system KDP operon response regulator KdpE